MEVQPYLFFDGRCEEAVEYYRKAPGAKADMLMRYKEAAARSRCRWERRSGRRASAW